MVTQRRVSLVIPGRDCVSTVRQCLGAVVPLLDGGSLGEILFVDDGSIDGTAEAVRAFPVTLIPGLGRGPGAARNLGIGQAQFDLVWFVDSDCVAESGALAALLPFMDDLRVGGVSGTYTNGVPESLLSCLVHEEIVERHLAMPEQVDFLATFNVLYRKSVLEEVGGFDERFLKGQDAELSFRVQEAGYGLRFTRASRVAHFHLSRWMPYLRVQGKQGYWRVRLHLAHRGHTMGDSYSSVVDHAQPPLAVLSLAMSPLVLTDGWAWLPLVPVALLFLATLPMTLRIVRRNRKVFYLAYAWMSFVRAYARGLGLTAGTLAYLKDSMWGQPSESGRSARAATQQEEESRP